MIEHFGKLQLRYGKILLPAEKCFQRVSEAVRPFGFIAQGVPGHGLRMYEITPTQRKNRLHRMFGIQGTCTLIKYCGKYLVLSTFHQFGNVTTTEEISDLASNIYVLIDDGRNSSNIPIESVHFSQDFHLGFDANDICIAVAHEPMLSSFKKGLFFPVEKVCAPEIDDDVICAGFFSAEQNFGMEIGQLRHMIGCVSGKVVASDISSSDFTSKMHYKNERSVLDGLSGGGVFGLKRNRDDIDVIFSGIVQRGGMGTARFLRSTRIIDIVRRKILSK